jgi:tyrosine-protein kinase Etk/Wzc
MPHQESDGHVLRKSELARGDVGWGGIDARQVWIALRRRYPLVLAAGIALFTLVMGFTFLSGMDFESSGRLYLGELDGKKQQQVNPQDFLVVGQGDVYSEIEIIESRSRVQQAVLAAGLNVAIDAVGAKPATYGRWLLSKRNLSLLDPTAPEISATQATPVSRAQEPIALTVTFGKGGKYIAQDEDYKFLGKGQLDEIANLKTVHILLARGSERAPRPGARYRINVRPVEEAVADALKHLEVSAAKVPTAVEPVKVLNLLFTNRSPQKAAAFLQNLMQVYLYERQSWKTEDANAAEVFVTRQLEAMQKSLGANEEKLADFRSAHPAVIQATQAEAVVKQLVDYEQQRTAARLQATALKGVQQALAQPKPTLESYMIGETEDAVLQGMAAALMEAQQSLAEFQAHLYEGAPEVVQQRSKVATQIAMIRSYVVSRLSRAQEQVRSLDAVTEQTRAKLQTVPTAELGLARMSRESEVYSRVYAYLLERQQQTQILRASTVSKNRIIDMPQVPVHEHSPALALRFASVLLGLLFGAMVVVLQSLSSSALRTEADARTALGATPIFASIPTRVRANRRSARDVATPIFDLFARLDQGGFAEAFRTLRTNLYYAQTSGHGKVVLISSPVPGDGKTTSTLCLATILAADRKRVMVIDADLRKPSHHLLTGHPAEPGLRDLLSGKCTQAQANHAVHVAGGTFDSIGAGFGAPAELLSTARLTELLTRLRHDYDYVLLDAASYPLVSDALVLARQSDFVLSVIRLGNTQRKVAEEHVRGLGAKAHGHAVVINDSDATYDYGYPTLAWQQMPVQTASDDDEQSEIRIQ